MKQFSYGERDYAFGQAMLTLRTALGLTQVGLAEYLGISRRAVGGWEAGGSYPKAGHLKQLIAFAVQQQAFPVEREAEEVRALWHAARQKVLLDEQWLAALLSHQCPSLAHTAPLPIEETRGLAPVSAHSAGGPQVDWGDALAVPTFHGREQELATLTQWLHQERSRMVSVLGMGGIGKSALVTSAMHQVAAHFQVVIFRSLRDAPSCEALLDECLQVLAPQPLDPTPASLEQRISLLLDHLRTSRVLLVLDNLESLLEEGDVRGHLCPDLQGYRQLLRRGAGTARPNSVSFPLPEETAPASALGSKRSHGR